MSWFEKPIALDPAEGGGLCISAGALQPADIIVSTTRAGVSRLIRVGTGSVVSHAALYIGNDEVIEAIGSGVTRRSLELALADDALAVAYRSPKITPAIASKICQFAIMQIGKPYSVVGAALSTDKVKCIILGPIPGTFFCSQLVFEAYKRGGLPLISMPSQCVTPQDAVVIAESRLNYVGHILGDPAWFPVISP